jgi:hypothetical protein
LAKTSSESCQSSLCRFKYCFHIYQAEELIKHASENILSHLKENFQHLHREQYQSQLDFYLSSWSVVDEWRSFHKLFSIYKPQCGLNAIENMFYFLPPYAYNMRNRRIFKCKILNIILNFSLFYGMFLEIKQSLILLRFPIFFDHIFVRRL